MRLIVVLALLLLATGLTSSAHGARLLRGADSLTSGDHVDVHQGFGHQLGPDPYSKATAVPPTYSSPPPYGYYSPPPSYSPPPPYGYQSPPPSGPYGPYTPSAPPSYMP